MLSITDKIGGPFTPVGFYYRTMIRPRRHVAHVREVPPRRRRAREASTRERGTRVATTSSIAARACSSSAGAGRVAPQRPRPPPRGPRRRARGRQPACSQQLELDGVEVLAPARALGIWEGGLVPARQRHPCSTASRAERIVVATGSLEQPLVFPGNDLVGVLLPEAVRRLVRDFAIKPGERAVVLAAPTSATSRFSTTSAAPASRSRAWSISGTRPLAQIEARGRKGRVRRVLARRARESKCDLTRRQRRAAQPSYSLLAQVGARVEYDHGARDLRPDRAGGRRRGRRLRDRRGVRRGASPTAHAANEGPRGQVLRLRLRGRDHEGRPPARSRKSFDSLELAKRYTTVTMGPCQGKLCQLPSIRLYARDDRRRARPRSARRPRGRRGRRSSSALLAGPHHEPARRTSIHFRHEEAGATMMWAGPWKRPWAYGEQAGGRGARRARVARRHRRLDAREDPRRGPRGGRAPRAPLPEPLRATCGRAGSATACSTTDGGRIMDDGTVARLADDLYYVTTTSTGADAVTAWFEWWNAVWGYEAEIVNVTGALAALNLAGPRAREALQRLDRGRGRCRRGRLQLPRREADRRSRASRASRSGSGSSASSATSSTSRARPASSCGTRLVAAGARPFGLEPQRVLRLEKGHIIVGQDTDSESNLLDAEHALARRSSTRTTSSASSRSSTSTSATERERLVGFTMEDDVVPAEGGADRHRGPAGRARDERAPERGGRRRDRARRGCRRSAPRTGRASRSASTGGRSAARVHLGRVLRPGRGADALVSVARLPLAVALRRGRRRRRSPLAPGARERRPTRSSRTSRSHGKVELRGDLDRVEPLAGRGARSAVAAARLPLHAATTRPTPSSAIRAQGVLAYDATGALGRARARGRAAACGA